MNKTTNLDGTTTLSFADMTYVYGLFDPITYASYVNVVNWDAMNLDCAKFMFNIDRKVRYVEYHDGVTGTDRSYSFKYNGPNKSYTVVIDNVKLVMCAAEFVPTEVKFVDDDTVNAKITYSDLSCVNVLINKHSLPK